MRLAELRTIHHRPRYPSVSLLANVGDDPDPGGIQTRLRAQLQHARDRLELETDPLDVDALIDATEQTIADVVLTNGVRSIAVYASPEEQRWLPLPVEVRERVVVDATFATRDVVHALLRARRYRVLVLGSEIHCYEGVDSLLHPAGTGPVAVRAARDGGRRDRRRSRERSDRDRRRMRATTRAADDALDAASSGDHLPLFVIGRQPGLAYFVRHSRHRRSISDTVVGGSEDAGALLDLVRPLVDQLFARTQSDAMGDVEAAASARRLASGIDEVFELAGTGRGALLLVEHGFEYPALVDPDGTVVMPAPDREAPDAVDDLVDEVIEAVLAHRGRVVLVDDGTLAEWGRIVMTLRY